VQGDGGADNEFEDAVRRFLEQAEAPHAPHEPSYAERQRAARQADLRRRLDEEAEHDRRLADRDRRSEHRGTRSRRRIRWLAPLLVLALVGIGAYLSTDRGKSALAGSPELRRPQDWPTVDRTASSRPLGTPPVEPAEPGPYRFARTDDDDRPVAWDPCRPIRYVVNPTNQPPGGDVLIREAIGRTAAATGLVFVDDGTTTETPSADRPMFQPERYGDRWAPVLVTWSTPAEVPELRDRVAGLGGPAAVGLDQSPMVNVTGSVALDAPQLTEVISFPGGTTRARAVVQHEFGHLVGLDHVDDRGQLMNPEAVEGVSEWGPGDLHGLHALGSGDCRPDI